jgi:hypothetical protein
MPYKDILKKVSPVKMATLGLLPTFIRNLLLLSVCKPIPKDVPGYGSIIAALSFGSIVISHPFEVIRVHAQFSGKGNIKDEIHSNLLRIYGQDGVAGFFKGLAPRTIVLMPVMLTWMMYQSH